MSEESVVQAVDLGQPLLVMSGVPMTQEEYIFAQNRANRVSRLFTVAWVVSAVFLAWVAISFAALLGGAERTSTIYMWLLAAITAAVVQQILFRRRKKQVLEQAYAAYRALRGDTLDQLRFYPEHLECIGHTRRMAIRYSDIKEFYEDSDRLLMIREGVLVSVPGRAMTPEQAERLRGILYAGLPNNRIIFKQAVHAQLEQPLPLIEIPDRPVTPPEALHQLPLRLEEARWRSVINTGAASGILLLSVVAGLLTALLLDPTGVFLWADVLCVIAWTLLSQFVIWLLCRIQVSRTKPMLLGMSAHPTGITVFAVTGETFVPKGMVAVRDVQNALMLQTPAGALYLPNDKMTDPDGLRRYFGL